MPMQSINPATEQVERTFEEHSDSDVERALAASSEVFETWRKTSFTERAGLMRGAAAYLRDNSQRLGGLITSEMGKPIRQSVTEVEKCAWCCDFYAEQAETILADRQAPSSAAQTHTS